MRGGQRERPDNIDRIIYLSFAIIMQSNDELNICVRKPERLMRPLLIFRAQSQSRA